MKLRASFVHVDRAAVHHRSIECSNRTLGFRCLCHFKEGDAARFARIPVFDNADSFDAAVDAEKLAQLLLRHRDVQVPNKNISHEIILYPIEI